MDEEYRARSAAEKATLEKTLTEKFDKEKADAISELTEKAKTDAKKTLQDSLLVISQFLRLAAARRSEEADAGLDENMALEGVLLNVYSGDENAVSTMLKLIEGSSEVTYSVAGEELKTTCELPAFPNNCAPLANIVIDAEVKDAAIAYISPFTATEAEPEITEAAPESTPAVETDPTVAHAGLTEIDSTGATEPMANGHTEAAPAPSAFPANANVSDDAANAAAGNDWDANNNMSASVTQEGWVEVPRDPSETETGLTATPAASSNVQSWADDHPDSPPAVSEKLFSPCSS